MRLFSNKKPERFSDFANVLGGPFPGKRIGIEEVLNKEVVIKKLEVRPSKIQKNNGEDCLYLQVEIDKKLCMVISGSKVLVKQVREYGSHVPFTTTIIRKNKRYLSFT